MQYFVKDLMSIQDMKGSKKSDYIVMIDQVSSYTWAKKLTLTRLKHIVDIFGGFSNAYLGPPFVKSSDFIP